MTYQRVIPRDLFNEANLLKCYGQLWLELENRPDFPGVSLTKSYAHDRFLVEQDDNDGSTTIINVRLCVRGQIVDLRRPLNSREPFPLYAYPDDATEIPVFDDSGNLTDEMTRFLKGEA